MYSRVVLNELGEIVKWYNEFKNELDVEKFLNEHPEYTIKCVEV